MALTDSSKANLVFLYGDRSTHEMISYRSVVTHLAEGRGYNLSVPFPLTKLRRHDIFPEEAESCIFLQGFGEFQAGAEDSLQGVHSLIRIPVHGHRPPVSPSVVINSEKSGDAR